jgi:hypothetical protein
MLGGEEVRRPLQESVEPSLASEVQHGNRIDRSVGSVFAWRRWLGLLSLARIKLEAAQLRLPPFTQ